MKIACNDESNGPVSPVWQSLKGLSSRDTGPLSPGTTSLNTQSFPLLSGSLSSGPSPSAYRSPRGGFHMTAHNNFPFTTYPESEETQSNILPQDNLETRVLNPSCRLSSSTTSTSLSNPNLVTSSHVTGLGGAVISGSRTDDPLHSSLQTGSKEDPQTFSIYGGLANILLNLYRHARYNKKQRRRIVHKNGECNITKFNVAKRRKRFLQDIFTTLLDMQWRWTLLIFALSFVLSWILFAAVWYSIMHHHGDFLPEHLPDRQAETGWKPCVNEIINFASCFLFSVETQHTIGYGSRHTSEECPQAIFVMCIQSITGVILQAFMGGVIFTKLSRPKKRTHTLIFSREACICQRDGELCLLFRVGDMRKSHIIEAHIRVQLIKERITEEGEIIPYYQYELDVGYDGGEDRILFIWPMTIVHKIDESSPLYELSAHDLLQEKFEIVVMLEGVIENTGMTIQARSSYLPSEIKWGYRFRPMLCFKEDIGECSVDYSLFNSSYEVATPLCSARYLQESSLSDYIHRSPSLANSPLSPATPLRSKSLNSCSRISLSRANSLVNSKQNESLNNNNATQSNKRNSLKRNKYLQVEDHSSMIPSVTTTLNGMLAEADEKLEDQSRLTLSVDSLHEQPLQNHAGQV